MAEEKKQAQTDAEETPSDGGEEEAIEDKAKESPVKEKPAEKKEAPKEEAKDETDTQEVELSPEFEELAKKYDKLISEIEKLSVVELAELVQVLEKKFGVSAAAPVAAADAGEENAEEKDSFSIMLQAPGDLKINVIKIVREITGLGLKESKELVDSVPKVIKEGVKKEEANEFKAKLEEAGATVELQ